jgi:hypothetical protein
MYALKQKILRDGYYNIILKMYLPLPTEENTPMSGISWQEEANPRDDHRTPSKIQAFRFNTNRYPECRDLYSSPSIIRIIKSRRWW